MRWVSVNETKMWVAFFHTIISIGRCCEMNSSQPITVNALCRQYLHYIHKSVQVL